MQICQIFIRYLLPCYLYYRYRLTPQIYKPIFLVLEKGNKMVIVHNPNIFSPNCSHLKNAGVYSVWCSLLSIRLVGV